MPAHDFVYAAERVIHDDGELIAEKPVGAAQNEIAAVAREILLIQPVVAVADGNRFIRHAQAVRGAAGFQLLRDGLRGEMGACAGVNGHIVAAVRRVGGVELRAGAEAGIEQACFIERVKIAPIDVGALALHERRFIPDDAQPRQIGNGGVAQALGAARRIQILDAQQKAPALTAGGEIRDQRAEQVAQMQPPARRGRETADDRRAQASISGVRGPLCFFSPSGVSSSTSSLSKSMGSVKCSFV